MKSTIKLHWSRSKPNFGDWLSPAICELLSGRGIEYAPIERCDLVAAGSLLDRLPERWYSRRLDVWGTGSIQETPARRSRHRYHAVRGPLTAGLLSNQSITTFGDPGLLAAHLLPEGRCGKRFGIGVVPHYKDAGSGAVAELVGSLSDVTMVDVFEPALEVIRRIGACHCVVSSSLHGLIVADALAVPSVWLVASAEVRGGGWKFRDYYAALGIENPRAFTPADLLGWSVDDLLAAAPCPDVDARRDGLLASFPYAR